MLLLEMVVGALIASVFAIIGAIVLVKTWEFIKNNRT